MLCRRGRVFGECFAAEGLSADAFATEVLRRVASGCFATEVADVSGKCFAVEVVGILDRCFVAEVAGIGWTDALPSVALADALLLLSLRFLSLLATIV